MGGSCHTLNVDKKLALWLVFIDAPCEPQGIFVDHSLQGHTRPIADLKYNADGDIIFIASKDQSISAWWTDNGERIGTYEDHTGSLWCIDISRDSKRMLSASSDFNVFLWEVETGKLLYTFPHDSSVRVCAFAEGDQKFLTVTDKIMRKKAYLHVYHLTENVADQDKKKRATLEIELETKVTGAIWGYHNETIITANADGTLRQYDASNRKELNVIQAHKKEVSSIRYNGDRTCFITASHDGKAKLWATKTLEVIATYETGRPLNAAAISPVMDHIIVGGGERAADVTLTSMTSEQFKVRFYHSIFGEELGAVAGHFGPVHVLEFSPDGRSFASGSEDGFVRLHYFPETYFSRTDEVSRWEIDESREIGANKENAETETETETKKD